MNVGCCKNYCGFIIDCKVRNSRKELIRVVIKILYDVRNIYGETNGKMEHEDQGQIVDFIVVGIF